jgi:hypothetical protein
MTFARPSPAEQQERRDARKAANLRALCVPVSDGARGVYRTSVECQPQPKSPALRSQALRDLAKGETCTVCMGGRCDSATTVWAHTNTLSDNKGMGYKASDERGFFAGDECHKEIDQGAHLSPDDKAALVLQAQIRTLARLREIAGNAALKPWRVNAAQWALDQLNAR